MTQARLGSVGARIAGELLTLVVLASLASGAAQDAASAPPEGLVNGDMERIDDDGTLAGWRVPPTLAEAGYVIGPEREDAHGGAGAARIDGREADAEASPFGGIMQSIDAAPYRGKRVRYRAAVKVVEASPAGRTQLWLRVDLPSPSGAPSVGFFDNMDDRPIDATTWQTYEIVGDVAPDAQRIALGAFTVGECLVLVDDATLEIVAADSAPTRSDPLARAPTQPFFTPWLVLPLVALALFALGFHAGGRLGLFALVFTCAYWTLYALPTLVGNLVPVWGESWNLAWEAGPVDAVVRWTAANVLGIEGELVSALGNGSGDTTFSYVDALVMFVLALAVAAVWTLATTVRALATGSTAERRPPRLARTRIVLRDALRYYLAVFMMGYGLAKLGTLYNQFSVPGVDRLARTYGESSPMGLLWTFMGSSRAYTAFAGASEVLGGVLLLWRRTTLLGALVSFGAMLNVMLLNFCYDVPVKLFSFHLVVAAMCIALPDAGRLAHFFLGIGPGAVAAPQPRGRVSQWILRAVAAYAIVMLLVIPVYQHVQKERSVAAVWPALGEWKLTALEIDGAVVEPGTGEVERLTLSRRAFEAEDGWTTDYHAVLVGGAFASERATLGAGTLALAAESAASRRVVGDFTWRVEQDELHLESPALRATFVPATRDSLLMSRGFRWINERPFNR